MNPQSNSSSRRSSKWPVITFAALLGAGAVAFVVARRRSKSGAEKGVDELIYLCEDVTGRLERSLNGSLTSLAS
jgi:hypothetical protein